MTWGNRKRAKPTAEGEAARSWREKVSLTVHELADATGYSYEAIYQYERGRRWDGSKLGEYAWQRYTMACAGVEAQMKSGRKFSW
jgi:predicted transcriptional regulator